MLVLAIDTALNDCAAVLWRDGHVLARESAVMGQGHAEALMPMIERVMTAANLTYDAIERIAVTCGPGSFTGVRIGIAAARGLAVAIGCPAVGVTTCAALAAAVPADERASGARVLAAVDSKRGDVFVQMFDANGHAISEISGMAPDDVESFVGAGNLILVGDAAAVIRSHLGERARLSRAAAACDAAVVAAVVAGRKAPLDEATPVYVRPPDVTIDPTGGRLRP